MSLVGPRPEVAEVLDVYEPWMFRRFGCRPGMTGLWQVRGRSGLPPREMLRLDVEYVDTWQTSLDLRIMALTPVRALLGRAE
jgi:lipopolysaccharide/colanic/teichoic acid biosynthesis glycosyltransferase